MSLMLLILAGSFILSLILTPLARTVALRWGQVDLPDGRRKMHGRAVPLAGGPAVLLAAASAIALALLLPISQSPSWGADDFNLPALLCAGAAICALGILDDRLHLSAGHKLIGQALAASIVIGSGVLVRSVQVFEWRVELGLLSFPFTLFLLLGAINSLNLIDGMDGLLGAVGVILSLSLAAMAALAGHWVAAAVALALAGALLGFLRYNLPPASVFLGDSGSMLVGLVLGTLAIQSSLKAPATIALSAPVALLILPIFDTTAAIVRRKLTGRSLSASDRGHLHHCLLRRGFSPWHALSLICFFSLLAGSGVLASRAFDNDWIALLTAATVIGTLVTTRLFGHAELVLATERLRSLGHWYLFGQANGDARQIAVRLQGSAEWQGLWERLTARAPDLDLEHICLNVNALALHEGYHARWDRRARAPEAQNVWRVEIPLQAGGVVVGRLDVSGRQGSEPVWRRVAAVTRLLTDIDSTLTAAAVGSVPAETESELPVAGIASAVVPVRS